MENTPSTIPMPHSTPPSDSPIEKPSTPPPVPHPSKRLWILMGLGILAAGILMGFLGANAFNPATNQSAILPTSIPSPTPTLATGADIFVDWKSYTNTAFRYSIKYPNDWKATSFGPGASTAPLDTVQRGLLLAPAPLQPVEGMGMPLEDISIHLEADSAQTLAMTYDAWVNDTKKNVASTTISISETTLASTETIVIQKEFSVVYLLHSPDKSLFYSIEVRSPTPDYRDTLDQILSTFQFLGNEPPTPSPSPITYVKPPLLDTASWKTFTLKNIQFKAPQDTNVSITDSGSAVITESGQYIPSATIQIGQYDGGSRRTWWIKEINATPSEVSKYMQFQDVMLGNVKALDVFADGGWWQGGYASPILIADGTTIISIHGGRGLNPDTGVRNRYIFSDTVASTIKIIE